MRNRLFYASNKIILNGRKYNMVESLNTKHTFIITTLKDKNQALVLAKKLFSEEKEEIKFDLLLRQTDTPARTGLSGQERRENWRNAIIVKRPSGITGRNSLILGDLLRSSAGFRTLIICLFGFMQRYNDQELMVDRCYERFSFGPADG